MDSTQFMDRMSTNLIEGSVPPPTRAGSVDTGIFASRTA